MVERKLNSNEEGTSYAQWGLMRFYNEYDKCPYDQWEKARTPQSPQQTQYFWLEQVPQGSHVSPVYGVVKNEPTDP